MMMSRKLKFATVVFCILFPISLFPQLNEGKGVFKFSEYKHMKDLSMDIFYYKPKGDVKNMPVLFVMHGTLRNADTYRDNWVDLANQYNLLIIAPQFDKINFPGSRSYNYGNMKSPKGDLVEKEYWSYSLIDPIFDYVVKITGSYAKTYDLFGHSAGSQFSHRMLLFLDSTKANRIVSANAGSYTMPVVDEEFPFGLKNMNFPEKQFENIFAKRLIIQLGENDNDPNGRYVPQSKDAKNQGKHRFERGKNFYETGEIIAREKDWTFNWELRTVRGVGHNNGKMAKDAAFLLYANE